MAVLDRLRYKNPRRILWLIGLAGLLLFTAVIAFQGIGVVSAAVASAGWGLVWVAAFHLIPLIVDAWAWKILLDKHKRIGLFKFTWISWIGEAVNSLLPVALIGGGVARARLLNLAGVPGAPGSASVVVDLTTAVISQIVFSLMGILLLVNYALPGFQAGRLLFGLLLFSLLIYGFYIAQRRGMFLQLARRLERLGTGAENSGLSIHAAELDRWVSKLYACRRQFWWACSVRLLGWVVGVGEVWLALHYLNHPVTIGEALMLESLGQAIRSAAFVVPGALGIQEGGYLVLGLSIGIAPETAVALSLVKRVRELGLGLPALLVWQRIEAKKFQQR